MKSTWFKDDARKRFASTMERANRGHAHLWDTFCDFLDCAHAALYQSARRIVRADPCADAEATYHRAMAKQREPSAFPEALAVVVSALEIRAYDFLGTFASEAGLLSKWGGQFFTPTEVAEMMAMMTLGDINPDPGHRLTICEPAVGAGSMALAVRNHLTRRGFSPRHWWIDCTDLDIRMAKAAYIQLSLCGVPGIVRCGNSLSLDTFASWPTTIGVLHPYHHPPSSAPLVPSVPQPEQPQLALAYE